MKKLKPYPFQTKAISAVRAYWKRGAKSVCLVCPTGGGKTFMGVVLVGKSKTLWVAHREELVHQAVKALSDEYGKDAVGYVMAGKPFRPEARIQVGTIQTLLARGKFPEAELLVLDECHHYLAKEWRQLHRLLSGLRRTLGLTATPSRGDGKALGDIFQAMVPAAQPQALIPWLLVPAEVFTPERRHGSDLAQYPVDAWLEYAGDRQGFVFCASVLQREGGVEGVDAAALTQRFRDNGISAALIHGKTPKGERRRVIDAFKAGEVKALVNCNVLTEGFNVPEAGVCMLVRNFRHPGAFIQATGRVLRKARGKKAATIIDLSGCVLKHGSPTDTRKYSLKGKPIRHGGGAGPVPGQTKEQAITGERLIKIEDQYIRRKKAKMAAYSAARNASPEGKAYNAARHASPERKAKQAAYYASPEGKAYSAARNASPEAKAKQAAYRASPEGKAKMAAYKASPEVKAKQAAYSAAYYAAYKAKKASDAG